MVVPNVKILRCNSCGQELIPAASLEQIEDYVAEATEQLPPAEIYAFLEQFDLNQKEAAEILGLGEKTVHRWLKGVGVVSRSMGYYLRLLRAHPNCLSWLQNREWRHHGSLSPQLSAMKVPSRKFHALHNRGGEDLNRLIHHERGRYSPAVR